MSLSLEKLPDWPAAMNREAALAYTGVAETLLRNWERAKRVRFSASGPNGAKLVLRSELDAALADLFGPETTDIGEDLDFGDG